MDNKQEIINALKSGTEYQRWHSIDTSTRFPRYLSLRVQIHIRESAPSIHITHNENGTYSFTSIQQSKIASVDNYEILMVMLFELLPYEVVMDIVSKNPSLISAYLNELGSKSRIISTIHGDRFLVYQFNGKSTITPILDTPIYIPESIYKECSDVRMLIPVADTPPMSLLGWRGISWGKDTLVY